MTDLIEFLRARLDEDPEVAEYSRDLANTALTGVYALMIAASDVAFMAHFPRSRALGEIDAKRRILARHRIATEWAWGHGASAPCHGCGTTGDPEDPVTEDIDDCPELRDLASVYADHADYRQEWTP